MGWTPPHFGILSARLKVRTTVNSEKESTHEAYVLPLIKNLPINGYSADSKLTQVLSYCSPTFGNEDIGQHIQDQKSVLGQISINRAGQAWISVNRLSSLASSCESGSGFLPGQLFPSSQDSGGVDEYSNAYKYDSYGDELGGAQVFIKKQIRRQYAGQRHDQ